MSSEQTLVSFPMLRQRPLDPPDEYSLLRRDQPVTRVRLWDGSVAWIVTRYADVRKVLLDTRFSAMSNSPGYPAITPGRVVTNRQEPSFIAMDPPDHHLHRRMVSKTFSGPNIALLKPQVTQIVDDLIDEMISKGPVLDLVTTFALALPSRVICEILGVPYEDRDYFHDRASVPLSAVSTETAQEAFDDLRRYVDRLIDTKLGAPGNDLLSELAHGPLSDGSIDRDALVSMVLLLLVAGHETTANMTALGILVLLQNPQQLAKLQGQNAGPVVAMAVEELLRYLTIAQYVPARVATEDVELGGQTIRAGEGIFALVSSANRDETEFPEPDAFDIERAAANHMAFGQGVHLCLGRHLARLELEIAFDSLIHRLPGLSIAIPPEEIRYKSDMTVLGVYALPVKWDNQAAQLLQHQF